MKYDQLRYIIKILLLNGLFVLFSHAMHQMDYHELPPKKRIKCIKPVKGMKRKHENILPKNENPSNKQNCSRTEYQKEYSEEYRKTVKTGFINLAKELSLDLCKKKQKQVPTEVSTEVSIMIFDTAIKIIKNTENQTLLQVRTLDCKEHKRTAYQKLRLRFLMLETLLGLDKRYEKVTRLTILSRTTKEIRKIKFEQNLFAY